MNHADKRNGFTLIELMLAMAFVSALLIAVAMTVIQIANTYNRGLTLKEVNQAGRSLASELQRSIAQSAIFNINPGIGSQYIPSAWGGRLCLGQYTYIWNYGKAISAPLDSNRNVYSPNPTGAEIRFVKVLDPNNSYCTTPAKKVDPTSAVELLNIGEHYLAVHNFSITTSATAADSKTGQQLYAIQFVLGTNDQNALTTDANGFADGCKLSNIAGADPAYCSVNQFDIVARAGNSVQ